MQQQITRGDYLEDLITIYVENNLQQSLEDMYSMFVFQCGEIQKQLTPAPVIKISFTEAESKLLTNYNTCYLAGITTDGHKETFNGSISFNTRGEVVYYEPTPNSSLQASTTSTIACPCTGISGVFSNCCQPAIKAYFSLNYVPTKLSELQNDTDFVDSVDVAESISIHNTSTEAHPYIQSVISTETEALAVSIQAETTAREEAVSLAISTTEAYTDTVVSVATEATKAYADSIVSTATTATEAYTDSVVQSATTAINTTIGEEVLARQGADNNLQGQIDALAAASDVTDIVGTYADLQSYDTQHLNNNDIIKVLSDETHDDEPSYYRFNKTAGTFSYIGSESAAYTKAQSNSIFVAQTTTVNGKALSSDISLTYSDVSALPATTQTVIDAHTSAIASNTSAIAANTTAIATNTSAISTINGKIPTDASTTNKLVSASTLSASIADFANKDLDNLSDVGTQKLRSLNAYANEGKLLTDTEGLAFVEKYAHSTFDLSKFTVTGSPNITDDGIANGFSSSNGVTVALNINDIKTLECFNRILYTATSSERIFSQFTGTSSGTSTTSPYAILTNTRFKLDVTINGTWQRIVDKALSSTLHTGDIVDVYYRLGQTSQTIKAFANGNLVLDESLTLTLSPINVVNLLPAEMSNNTVSSIDFKYLRVLADGVEVFSGNRTGIDTIKPDNYTVVGSPTISADGVASGFSGRDYFTITNSINTNNSITIKLGYHYNDNIGGGAYQFTGGILNGVRIFIGKLVNIWGSSQLMPPFTYNSTLLLQDGDFVLTEITFESNKITFKATANGISVTNTSNVSLTLSSTGMIIGTETSGSSSFRGSIDLNSFKIYVDGNLVYQPCLKIPYTESKTGSKIVNSVYRDRVSDMAEQYGYANYYTLSDIDFTLPQVELYGLIGQRTLRDNYRNGINYWELYSNRDLEQGGSCTSGVEVTFARPFADTNYVLSVPYSAKSSTTFTPTQTGDWIAKGKGIL